MSHRVVELTSFDVYRDGGSISISYLTSDGIEYTLLFKIDLSSRGSEGKKKKYRSASLQKHRKADYVSPVTGVSPPDGKAETQEIDWEYAKKILKEIEPFQKSFSTDYEWVFESMVEVVNTEGHYVKTRNRRFLSRLRNKLLGRKNKR